jgi:ankyrin repeat protein
MTLPELFALLASTRDRPKSPGERLADAIEARDLDAVRAALTEGAKPQAQTRDGRLPLWAACKAGFDDAVVAMAEAGVRANELLDQAVMHGRFGLVRRLLALRKPPSKKALAEALASSPLLFADVELVREFVARGVDLKKTFGPNPLYLINAAASGSVEALRLVLDAGHSPHYRDESGSTLIHFAASSGSGDPAAVVRYLLSLGVRPNQPTAEGHTALHNAVLAGNVDAARALIDAGEDLHARHEQTIPGMTREQSARHSQEMAEQLQNLLGQIGFDPSDDDGPPPPDTSHPLGEKMADLLANFQQYASRMSDVLGAKLAERAAGGLGLGASVAELAQRHPHVQPVLAELEAYVAEKKAPDGSS